MSWWDIRSTLHREGSTSQTWRTTTAFRYSKSLRRSFRKTVPGGSIICGQNRVRTNRPAKGALWKRSLKKTSTLGPAIIWNDVCRQLKWEFCGEKLKGILCCQDTVPEVVNLLNSLRRPLIWEVKLQIEILSGLPAYMPINCRNPTNDQRSTSGMWFVTSCTCCQSRSFR